MADADVDDGGMDSFDIYDYWEGVPARPAGGSLRGPRVRHMAGDPVRRRRARAARPERFPSRVNADTMGPVMGTVILAMDGEEHRRYRNLVAHAFRPSALVRWEDELIAPTIHRLIDGIVDRAPRRARGRRHEPVPRPGHRRRPRRPLRGLRALPHAGASTSPWVPTTTTCPPPPPAAMREYLTPIVEDRKAHPTDDLVSDIVTAEIDGERLSDEHIYGFLRLLLPAGAETTFRALGNCLARPPRPGPTSWPASATTRRLLDAVIEETLRWETSVTMVNRETACPVEIDGVEIPQGVSVVVRHRLGQPRRVPLRRPRPVGPRPPRAAPHRLRHRPPPVPGMHLARLELRVGLGAAARPAPGTAPRRHRPGRRRRARRGPRLPLAAAPAGGLRLGAARTAG